MKIKILDKISWQSFPEVEGMIEMDEKLLEQIGKTKKFNIYTNEIVDYINLDDLRMEREIECFSIVNRGQLWYNTLTEEQSAELEEWYQAWLNVTESKVMPDKPEWLN